MLKKPKGVIGFFLTGYQNTQSYLSGQVISNGLDGSSVQRPDGSHHAHLRPPVRRCPRDIRHRGYAGKKPET